MCTSNPAYTATNKAYPAGPYPVHQKLYVMNCMIEREASEKWRAPQLFNVSFFCLVMILC